MTITRRQFPNLVATVHSVHLCSQGLDCATYLLQSERFYCEADDQCYRMGATLWQEPPRWIRNSAVFCLERAVAPTLLLVGEYDAAPRAMKEVYSILHGMRVPVGWPTPGARTT